MRRPLREEAGAVLWPKRRGALPDLNRRTVEGVAKVAARVSGFQG